VSNATSNGHDWTKDRVTGATQPDDFPADSILLRREGERNKRNAGKVIQWDGSGEKALLAHPALDILQGERSSVRRGASVFAGSEQEKECQAYHVGNGLDV
jgi:hypothetical protein